jgi:hypothetical protein
MRGIKWFPRVVTNPALRPLFPRQSGKSETSSRESSSCSTTSGRRSFLKELRASEMWDVDGISAVQGQCSQRLRVRNGKCCAIYLFFRFLLLDCRSRMPTDGNGSACYYYRCTRGCGTLEGLSLVLAGLLLHSSLTLESTLVTPQQIFFPFKEKKRRFLPAERLVCPGTQCAQHFKTYFWILTPLLPDGPQLLPESIRDTR